MDEADFDHAAREELQPSRTRSPTSIPTRSRSRPATASCGSICATAPGSSSTATARHARSGWPRSPRPGTSIPTGDRDLARRQDRRRAARDRGDGSSASGSASSCACRDASGMAESQILSVIRVWAAVAWADGDARRGRGRGHAPADPRRRAHARRAQHGARRSSTAKVELPDVVPREPRPRSRAAASTARRAGWRWSTTCSRTPSARCSTGCGRCSGSRTRSRSRSRPTSRASSRSCSHAATPLASPSARGVAASRWSRTR